MKTLFYRLAMVLVAVATMGLIVGLVFVAPLDLGEGRVEVAMPKVLLERMPLQAESGYLRYPNLLVLHGVSARETPYDEEGFYIDQLVTRFSLSRIRDILTSRTLHLPKEATATKIRLSLRKGADESLLGLKEMIRSLSDHLIGVDARLLLSSICIEEVGDNDLVLVTVERGHLITTADGSFEQVIEAESDLCGLQILRGDLVQLTVSESDDRSALLEFHGEGIEHGEHGPLAFVGTAIANDEGIMTHLKVSGLSGGSVHVSFQVDLVDEDRFGGGIAVLKGVPYSILGYGQPLMSVAEREAVVSGTVAFDVPLDGSVKGSLRGTVFGWAGSQPVSMSVEGSFGNEGLKLSRVGLNLTGGRIRLVLDEILEKMTGGAIGVPTSMEEGTLS